MQALESDFNDLQAALCSFQSNTSLQSSDELRVADEGAAWIMHVNFPQHRL